MQDSDTLVIRHLSSALTDLEKEDFLKHFGAVKVKCVTSQYKKYNVVFAKFSSITTARAVLQRLHQVEVLGTPLTVEYAREKETFEDSQENCSANKEKCILKKKHKDFVQKLNAWHHSLQPIRPPPYHLKYEYPPATISVLTNICRSIAVVPKLYTQILHLMNRMNLPCPLGPLLPGPEIYVVTKQAASAAGEKILQSDEALLGDVEVTESEESEIEGEERQPMDIIPVLPTKRNIRQSGKHKRKKRMRLAVAPAIIPSTRVPMRPEEMFEREAPIGSQPKKIELNIAVQAEKLGPEENVGTSEDQGESLPGFGILPPTKKPNLDDEADGQVGEAAPRKNEDETSNTSKNSIAWKELKSNRIPVKDQKVLPVFKNYQTGAPSCRLYVKNIAKHVEPKDLHYIYSSFLDEKDEEQSKMFDVRLMQEGRMKGQAFITLPSTAQAKVALSETNGYILKGKPLVVQFARSAKPK